MAGTQVQTAPTPLTGYAEVTAAFEIIREVRKANLTWQPTVLNTVLYEGTELARPVPRRRVGQNEIIMKNVYYLATQTENVPDELVLSLVDADAITVDEGNIILGHPTNKLRAVKMFAILIEKEDPDDSIATSVASVLHAHGNEKITNIFRERFNIGRIENVNAEGRRDDQDERQGSPVPVDVPAAVPQAELENDRWPCIFCTFINGADTNICEVCSKTKDFNLDDSLEVNICPQCTLMNENGVDFCDACGFRFVPPVADEDDNDNDADASDEN